MADKIYVTPEQIDTVATDKSSQETVMAWSRDDCKVVIDTSDNTVITKLKHMMERDSEHYKCFYYDSNVDEKTNRPYNYVFETDVKLISFRIGQTQKKELTAEEKASILNRLKKNKQ